MHDMKIQIGYLIRKIKKPNAKNLVRKSQNGRKRRQISLTTDYYRLFSQSTRKKSMPSKKSMKSIFTHNRLLSPIFTVNAQEKHFHSQLHSQKADCVHSQRARKAWHENPARKSHAQNVHHKAWSRIRVRPEKETGFIHRQRKEWRRKNPDQNTEKPAMKKNSNLMTNQLLSPLLNKCSINIPPPTILPKSLSHAYMCITSSPPNPKTPTILKHPCLGYGAKGMQFHMEI